MGSFIKYRLKIFLKNKTMIFWTLLFPIALTTMFYFVFSDIQFVDEVKPFKIAVVDGKNTNVKQLLSSLSDKQSENYLLDVIYASEDEAKALVKEQEVEAMVVLDNPVQLVSIRMGYNQTIMKSVLNTYERVFSQVNHIALENPQALSDLVIEDLLKSDVYFHTLNSQGSQKDMNTTYFYTALALLCMYGALWGCIITHDIQANQSKRAARLNLAPISKKKLLFADFTLAYGLISLELFLLFAYMKFVLHVAFGHQLWLMLCVCLAGILAMLSVGVLFGTLKLNWNNKVGIVSGGSVILNFFAGMMGTGMPYMIEKYAPIMKFINPADLISRSFSYLYYYDDLSLVYVNIGILLMMGMIFSLFAYYRMRRESYASI